MRYQRAPRRATRVFQQWKHNSVLLPRLQEQLEMLLRAHGKFREVVYDTQGMHDDGVDLVLRVHTSRDDATEILGFQVKSFGDLSDRRYMKELKSQRDDAFRKVQGLQQYFLLLCTDIEEHQDRVRNIAAEFRSAGRTEVIEPAFALTFLQHPQTRVDAMVKLSMESEDLVVRLALDSVEYNSPTARVLAAYLATRYVLSGDRSSSVQELWQAQPLRFIYDAFRSQQQELLQDIEFYEELTEEEWDDDVPPQIADFEDQLGQDLALLDGDSIDLDPASELIVLRVEQLRPLVALISDALARNDYDEQELRNHTLNLIGVRL